MALLPGARLGSYEIRSVLGSGGMGDVYVARDTHLNRDVALKLLPAGLTTDPDRLRRFEQEARAASALNHPAIVAIYELGQAGAQPYISMELVDGLTLREMLEQGAMAPRRALHIAAQIADGLAKAHEAGIVHRDLKPENLMVSPDGFAKILDFGLAKLVDGDAESRAALHTITEHGTRPGSVLGTVGYMSPEQASGQAVDGRSDQFSFGLVLYEMLTGERAFARPTAAETMAAIIREDPPPLDRHNPPVPAPVRWMVDRCLAKAPAERYASTRDLARDLAGARDHLSELTTATASARPHRSVPRREAMAWTVAALLGAAVLGLLLRGAGTTQLNPPRPVRFTMAPPANGTFFMNIGSSPFALSPDGHHLAFVLTADGRRQIWLRSFDALVSRPLPGTEGAEGPFWAPDGLAIGFFADNRLKRVPLSGGEATTICDARGGGGATWNRDGVILFAPSIDSGLYRVAEAGGDATPVTALDAAHEEAAHLFPVFLPDGRHFAFQVLARDNAGVHVGSLDATGHKPLLPEFSIVGFSAPDYLVFVRDRDIMAQRIDLTTLHTIGDPALIGEDVARAGPSAALAVSASGAVVYWSGGHDITQPTWVKRDGTSVGTVGPPAAYMNVTLSPDGRRAAVNRFDTPGVWLLDVVRGTLTRSTFGKTYESTPVWAPDSGSFAFAAARDAPPNLFLKRLDTSGQEERLFRTSVQSFPQSWSLDGQFIAYMTVDPKTGADIWVLPLDGDRKPVPLIQTPYFDGYPRISPDGRWVAYTSNESGSYDVYVTRFPQPAGKWPVSVGGGGSPVWSRDGRELFYRAPDGKLMSVAVTSGSDFEAAAPKVLFATRGKPGMLGFGTFYDVASDGRFLINVFVDRTTTPATVVLNWPTAIARPEPLR